ncbi:DNA-methyltransferase [Shimia sagamensis]|uniref:Methyltransferase n=1 Tax=Shimia sagamensis TaxID=1566352 RepID=A0ABY1PFT5_9RHOB|nr:site-specific DNA-methyltransferase [Shimia sagamensis]SMP32051.1 DNA modification methylase [Shimia sagamensis]
MSIVREVTIGNIRLIQGDMRAVLPELIKQGVRADLLATDPPYKLTSGGKASKAMGGKFAPSVYDNSGELMAVVPWEDMAPVIYPALADDADAYVMAEDKNIFRAHAAFVGAGFDYHSLLVWDKLTASRTRYYRKRLEHVLYLWKGKARDINFGGSDRIFRCPRPKNALHPTQKPVDLMAHYIGNSTDAGQLVLDPFMGAGTTLVAAAQLGRAAIGIELESEWFDLAFERVEQAVYEVSKNAPVSAHKGALAV